MEKDHPFFFKRRYSEGSMMNTLAII
ncbi:MAG: hypothetical protein JWP44_4486, partial [Mucilaginibacter sp.]|nr:hypothetical protein [Mucilaginibacter sp.]